MREALASVMDKDALLATDGNTSYPPCAAALGVRHEVPNQSSEECIRGKSISNTLTIGTPASRNALEVVEGSPQNILSVIWRLVLSPRLGEKPCFEVLPRQRYGCDESRYDTRIERRKKNLEAY